MKKSISMLLAALVLTGALSGCGGSSSSESSDSQASGNDSGVSGAITVISREDGSGTRGAFIELTGSMLKGIRTMTANIVLEMGYATGLHREALIATGVVLFVFILLINLAFSVLKRRKEA